MIVDQKSLQMKISYRLMDYLRDYMEEVEDPLYIYDTDRIRENCKLFMQIGYNPKSIHFASMANINPAFLNITRDEGLRIFVNSPEHLQVAVNVGFEKEEIIYTASALNEDSMRSIESCGAIINLDSPAQLDRWETIFPGKYAGIRCNLGELITARNTLAGYFIGNQSRLGFLPEEIYNCKGNPNISGLHLYVGTALLDLDYFFECYRVLWKFADMFPNLRMMNLGGGFGLDDNGIPRFDFETYEQRLSELMHNQSKRIGREIILMLEPGRIIGGKAGFFACKVTDVKIRGGAQFVGVNASATQFPRPLFYPETAKHPVMLLRNGNIVDDQLTQSNIYGCSTYSRDFLLRNSGLAKTQIDDWIVFGNAGSYCASAHTRFLGFKPAKEIFL